MANSKYRRSRGNSRSNCGKIYDNTTGSKTEGGIAGTLMINARRTSVTVTVFKQ